MGMMLTSQEMKQLMGVALGQEKADLVLLGGDIVNVYSDELLRGWSIATKGKWIAYVGPDASHTIGPNTEVVEAHGKVLIPGFIDGHAHMIWFCTPDHFVAQAAKAGTTTIITELSELNHFGTKGILEYLRAVENQPIKIFGTVPPGLAFSKAFQREAPPLDELTDLLSRENIVGVGEGYWQEVLLNDGKFRSLASESLRLGKAVEGHAAGSRGNKLQAYLCTGVSSCHESISPEEAVEKIRAGIFVMIRQGSIRKDLESISEINAVLSDQRHLALVSDGLDPRELCAKGYLECTVQRAIELGFDPISAIKMATLNPAEYFHLDRLIGGIAPGKCADILMIPELSTIKAEYVISNGEVIAKEGRLLVELDQSRFSIKRPQDVRVSEKDFSIRTRGKGLVKVRVVDYVTNLVTKEAHAEMIAFDGKLKADPERDILKAALVNNDGKNFTGLIRGFGIKGGALAISNGWEASGITVIGVTEKEMAEAVNRVSELGGGIVFCLKDEAYVELSLPIGGLLSNRSLESTAQSLNRIQRGMEDMGCGLKDACLALSVLTTPAIPFVRISEDGLVDVRNRKVLSLFL